MSKEAMKLALEGAANYIDALGGDSRKYRQALANEALDKKAENARELGLDYEPVGEAYLCDKCQTPFDGAWECPNCGHRSATKESVYTTPPAQPAPVQEPCSKCHGLGYYDEGHENDDGSMSGGNYVDCEKCKPPTAPTQKHQINQLEKFKNHVLANADALGVVLDTTTAQRQWVGLSDEDWKELHLTTNARTYGLAIEAKLKDNNNG